MSNLVGRSGEAHIAAELRDIAKETGCGQRQMHLEIAAQIVEQGQFLHPDNFVMAITIDEQKIAIEARDREIARLREALTLIEKAETEVFDEDDTEDWVTVAMDMDEASRIAKVALLNCTCMEVFGENPDCVAHGRAAVATEAPDHG